MNLAIGGNFDGGVTPNPGDIPATLQVDYVRVYKDNGGGQQNPEEPAPPSTIVIGDEVKGLKKTGDDLLFYVNGATFADLHYKVNNGVQLNVAMTGAGNGNYTYAVNNLKQGDTVEYFFTYNPGQGALDTPWQTYVHGVTQGTPE